MPYESICEIDESEKRHQTVKKDIFSLGILFYFTITNRKNSFYEKPKSAHVRISCREPPKFNDMVQADKNITESLLRKMLNHTQEERSSIDEVLSHHIFWNIKRKLTFIRCVAEYCNDRKNRTVLSSVNKNNVF